MSTTRSTVASLTWTTYGLNILSLAERLRLQLDWIVKNERPVDRSDEVAQLQAIF